MTNPDKMASNSPKSTTPTPSAPLENQSPGIGTGVTNIVKRWRQEDLLRKGSLALRGIGLLFSFLAFVIMASNKHGDEQDFNKFEEYRYLLAIAILSTLYTGLQTLREVLELSTGKELLSRRTWMMLDFFGDQVMAYFLISAASSAIPLTNQMRKWADNIFTDSASAAISMEFLAFFTLALSALVSGYKLSNQSYF